MKPMKRFFCLILICGLALIAAAGHAASHQYGKVNANQVRFRKEAEKTDCWAMLDKGWPVEILDTKTSGGVKYYRVTCSIPNHTDRQYWGYIQQKYVTKTSSKVAIPSTSSSSSSSSSSSGTTKTESGKIKTTDEVRLRKSPSTSADVKTTVDKGTVLSYSAIVTQDGTKWYKVKYNSSTCYVMAKFCKTVSDSEKSSSSSSSKETYKDTNKPADPSTTALTTKEKVILRASASADGKQVLLLTKKNTVCTLQGSSKKADGYVWYKVKADGKTGWIRGDLIRILSKAEAKTYTEKASDTSKGTLYEPELTDWSSIKSIFYKGCVAKVTDVKTGISFKVKRWSGGLHADVEPYTASDTKKMCQIYGVKDAQTISDLNLYQRRPILVTIGTHSYAASMYGVPHNYPEGDTIDDNNYKGQFCIHFVDSKVHKTKKVDSDHQHAIKYAYYYGKSILSKKGYKFK